MIAGRQPSRDVLERIFTVETIMTLKGQFTAFPEGEETSKILRTAKDLAYDLVPIMRGDSVVGVFRCETAAIEPVTQGLLVSSNTSIHHVVSVFAQTNVRSLLVIHGQQIVGIVTPADLNKLGARTYFYNVIAALEMALADRIRALYRDQQDVVRSLISDERIQKIDERIAQKDIEIDFIQALDFAHIITVIAKTVRTHEEFGTELGLTSRNQVEHALKDLREFRDSVMHTNSLILSNIGGIKLLHERLEKIDELLGKISS